MTALAVALLAAVQDPEAIRAVVERLGSEEVAVRDGAEKELLKFPVGWTPALVEAAERSSDAEVRTRVSRSTVPAAWTKLLRGTIGEARRDLQVIRDLGRDRRDLDLQGIFLRLDERPPAEVRSLLIPLLDSDQPGERDAALFGLKAHPPGDLAPFIRLLSDPKVGMRAAELLAVAGDSSVVPAALDLLAAGSVPASRVLRRFGAAGRVKDLLRAFDAREGLRSPVVRILERTREAEADDALLGMLDRGIESLDAAATLSQCADPRVLPKLKAWAFRATGETYWDHWLLPLGDAEWARRRLDGVIKGKPQESSGRATWYASVAGSAAREPILAALKDPAAKLSLRKQLLPALGIVAKPEDVPWLVEQLRDDRLVKEAGEALDMTGDPRRAKPMMEAFKRVGHAGLRVPHVLTLSPEAIEDDLLEILSDSNGYGWQFGVVLPLVARRPVPRLREALFASKLGHAILASTAGPADAQRVEKLRKAEAVEDRVFGLTLALKLGDESVAPELAQLVIPDKGRIPLQVFASVFVHWPDLPGTAWPKAVEEAWRRSGREDWTLERWLAARGVPDALDRVRKRRSPSSDPIHRPNPEDEDANLLARRGEAAALARILERAAVSGPLPPGGEQAFLAGADRSWRLRLLAAARRARLQASGGALRLAALAAMPEGVPLYRAAISPSDNHPEWSGPGDVVTIPCLEALATLGVREAIPEIRPHLRSRLARIAAAAAMSLARLGDRDSLPAIAALLDRPDETANEEWDIWRPRPDGASRRLWDAALEALGILAGEPPAGASTLERRAGWRARHAKPGDR